MHRTLLALVCLITGALVLLSASCGGLGVFAFFDHGPYRGWAILSGIISLGFAVVCGLIARFLFLRIRRQNPGRVFRLAWMAAAFPLLFGATFALFFDLHTATENDPTGTILAGDRLVCRTNATLMRGDFLPVIEADSRTAINQVVALPLDRLTLREGAVYVNEVAVRGVRAVSPGAEFSIAGQQLPNLRGFIEIPVSTMILLDSAGTLKAVRTTGSYTKPVMILFSAGPASRWFHLINRAPSELKQ